MCAMGLRCFEVTRACLNHLCRQVALMAVTATIELFTSYSLERRAGLDMVSQLSSGNCGFV